MLPSKRYEINASDVFLLVPIGSIPFGFSDLSITGFLLSYGSYVV